MSGYACNNTALVDPELELNQVPSYEINDDTRSKLLDEITRSGNVRNGLRSSKQFLKALGRLKHFKEMNPKYVIDGSREGPWLAVSKWSTLFKSTNREALSNNDKNFQTRIALIKKLEPTYFNEFNVAPTVSSYLSYYYVVI